MFLVISLVVVVWLWFNGFGLVVVWLLVSMIIRGCWVWLCIFFWMISVCVVSSFLVSGVLLLVLNWVSCWLVMCVDDVGDSNSVVLCWWKVIIVILFLCW